MEPATQLWRILLHHCELTPGQRPSNAPLLIVARYPECSDRHHDVREYNIAGRGAFY